MLVLSGVGVIALGFLLRFNPLLVIVVAAAVTGLAAGLDPLAILAPGCRSARGRWCWG
jgi:uncharacterized membrane protein